MNLFEVSILAGGGSTRMGRNKARLKLGGRTLVAHVRAAAGELGAHVRVIRRDVVPRCGPLGGIYTALSTARTGAVLFMACDAPFVSAELLRRLVRSFTRGRRAVFVAEHARVGFPFILPSGASTTVAAMIAHDEFSLQQLADAVAAKRLPVSREDAALLFNVNTPEDWARARARWRRRKTLATQLVNARRGD